MVVEKAQNVIEINVPEAVGELDQKISFLMSKLEDDRISIILNFEDLTFIEVASLVYIISFLKQEISKNHKISLKLPKSKDVRDFFRAWEFPRALKNATGITFSKLVCEENLQYFGENIDGKNQKYGGRYFQHNDKCTRLFSKNYFPIFSFMKNVSDFTSSIAFQEASRWKKQFVLEVFKKHIHGPEDYFSSRIIFEAIMNSIRHPKASIIQIASHLASSQDGQTYKNKFFTLICWDDGNSIIDTLREPLNKGLCINYPLKTDMIDSYKVSFKDKQNLIFRNKIFTSDFIPATDSKDYEILLASFFAGITRDIKGDGHLYIPDNCNKTDQYKQPGMGLYLLVNAAIKIYQGEVAIRTRDYFLNIKGDSDIDKLCDYKVKIQKYTEPYKFLGNMITVRLPLKSF
jgi:hypothetical protein